ncbi:hydroxyisourate hydrolase [Mycolicibacterium boenickei]|nr:hydroxyisourate hydrolase [Mycolicibacterium boenickei]
MSLSTHVLDAVSGRPAVGVAVTLADYSDTELATGVTDNDGRIGVLSRRLEAGRYRLRFDTGAYFAAQQARSFYPEVVVSFEVVDPDSHHHVPLLLSPYAYSTYRGS